MSTAGKDSNKAARVSKGPKSSKAPKGAKASKATKTSKEAKTPRQPKAAKAATASKAARATKEPETFPASRASKRRIVSNDQTPRLPAILQANVFDTRGGAARIAWQLHQAYLAAGLEAFMAVGVKFSDDPRVMALPNDGRRGSWAGPLRRLEHELIRRRVRYLPGVARGLSYLAEPSRFLDAHAGREDFHYPATREMLEMPPLRPGILHAHVLHSGWFDLRELPVLSQSLPTVVTMHDEWIVTGHCAYAMGCERFRFGCGNCPDLQAYPSVKRDATGFNWKRKRNILRRAKLHVAAPSRWLLDRLLQAYPPFEPQARVVRNGIDLHVFRPSYRLDGRSDNRSGNRQDVRAALGLTASDKVVLYMAHGGKDNARKGFGTARQAFLKAAADVGRGTADKHVLLCLGGDMAEERGENWSIRSAGFVSDMAQVARHYQAADVFLHAALQDNYPNTVLEAQACGTPVVATAVGGVPEQIDDGRSGYLVPAGNADAMAAGICRLLHDADRRRAMGERAARTAQERHGLERMAREYLDWYSELLDESAHGQARP
ncbi:glycosyltransferase [Desulfocurvibacter africanus]|uniref:glycosyltransferase n=1 Tax=Desulfocurvibacter africanus TaxID=873 RepID=UPI0004831BBA|nr:glycosyltransferase [Desulfocurvibacter africanus]